MSHLKTEFFHKLPGTAKITCFVMSSMSVACSVNKALKDTTNFVLVTRNLVFENLWETADITRVIISSMSGVQSPSLCPVRLRTLIDHFVLLNNSIFVNVPGAGQISGFLINSMSDTPSTF